MFRRVCLEDIRRYLNFGMPGKFATQREQLLGHPVSGWAWSSSSHACLDMRSGAGVALQGLTTQVILSAWRIPPGWLSKLSDNVAKLD